jgi:hypothetical protein
MRILPLIPVVIVLAACANDARLTGPGDDHVAPSATPVAMSGQFAVNMKSAVDDALSRLVPGLSPDAATPIGASLRSLSTRLTEPTASETVVRAELERVLQTLARFGGSSRTDTPTLDAISLELTAAQ